MTAKTKIVSVIAAAAAIAFVSAPITSTIVNAASKKVHCYGVNSCKGKSKCKTANNACKGQNSCKASGVVMKSAKQCAKLGGTTTEPAKSDAAPAPADSTK